MDHDDIDHEGMSGEVLAAWLRLLLTPGLGPAKQRRLLAAFGLPKQVFAAPSDALAGEAGTVRVVASPSLAQAAANWAPPRAVALDCLSQGVMMGEWLLVDCSE